MQYESNQLIDDDQTVYWVDVPPSEIDEEANENPFINVRRFSTEKEALGFAQKYYGADEFGRVWLVTPCKDENK